MGIWCSGELKSPCDLHQETYVYVCVTRELYKYNETVLSLKDNLLAGKRTYFNKKVSSFSTLYKKSPQTGCF